MNKLSLKQVNRMLENIFEDVHTKRVEALANYAVGAMVAPRAAVHAIGAAYAAIAHIQPRSGVKQVDRLLSNEGLPVEELTSAWARFLLGPRTEVNLAMDWTDFEPDDHTTLAVYIVTTHGRATPLAWKTVKKSSLGDGERTQHEHDMIDRLALAIPPEISITVLADRGFGDQVLYQTLSALGWDYVIRFRGCILVEHEGTTKPASEWLPRSGRATKLANAFVTADRTQVGAVVVVKDKRMADAWILATSFSAKAASSIIKLYGRRFTIETAQTQAIKTPFALPSIAACSSWLVAHGRT